MSNDWLDGVEFYELMQAYRLAPAEDQIQAKASFDLVKAVIRGKGGCQEVMARTFVLEVLVNDFKDATMDINSEKVSAAHEVMRELGL